MASSTEAPSSTEAHGMAHGKALVALLFITIAIVVYFGVGTGLGITPLYAGFAFAYYFGGFKGGSLSEWPATVVGALGGVFLAALLHFLPQHYGSAGLVFVLVVILAAVYALLVNWLPLLINQAFMLFLTIATIPPVMEDEPFVGMAAAILLAAAFLGGLQLLATWMAARKAVTGAAQQAI